MKHLFTLLTIAALSLSSQEVFASALTQKSTGYQAALQARFGEMNMSASEFTALTPKEIAKKTGKKMSWGESILFKIAQNRIKKQLVEGVPPSLSEGSSKKGNTSLILAGTGVLVFILVLATESGGIALLGLICGIVGLIFGIMGLAKDDKKIMAIIGTALSAIVVLLMMAAFAGLSAG